MELYCNHRMTLKATLEWTARTMCPPVHHKGLLPMGTELVYPEQWDLELLTETLEIIWGVRRPLRIP